MIDWISVDERLPEREANYLIFTRSDGAGKGCFHNGKFIYRAYFGGTEVTHWAEINEPNNKKQVVNLSNFEDKINNLRAVLCNI